MRENIWEIYNLCLFSLVAFRALAKFELVPSPKGPKDLMEPSELCLRARSHSCQYAHQPITVNPGIWATTAFSSFLWTQERWWLVKCRQFGLTTVQIHAAFWDQGFLIKKHTHTHTHRAQKWISRATAKTRSFRLVDCGSEAG